MEKIKINPEVVKINKDLDNLESKSFKEKLKKKQNKNEKNN